MLQPPNTRCYCGSQQSYITCCEPFITGKQHAKTPEALMRSRYSAYAQANIPYIEKTMQGTALAQFNHQQAQTWASQVRWLGLEVHHVSSIKNNEGFVEFIAKYADQNGTHLLHENSRFLCEKGRWYYVDGERFSNKA